MKNHWFPFSVFILFTIMSCENKSAKECIEIKFLEELEIRDLEESEDIYQKQILVFPDREDTVFIFQIQNFCEEQLLVSVDRLTGQICTESRRYAPLNNHQIMQISDYGIYDFAPIEIDTISPGCSKKYFAGFFVPKNGFVEIFFLIKSPMIYSINNEERKHRDQQNHRLVIQYPSCVYEVKGGALISKVQNFDYSKVVFR